MTFWFSGFPAFAENDEMGSFPRTIFTIAHSPSSPSLQSGGPFLAECISGFPAFAENVEWGLTRTLASPFIFFVFQEWLGIEAQEVLSGSTM